MPRGLRVPARTTQEAYRNCDAETPLPPDDGAYVDLAAARGQPQNFAKRVAWAVENLTVDGDATHIGLMSGHRGCGKSTELFRVQRALEEGGWAVAYLDAFAVLDQNDLEASDVMVALCEKVAELATAEGEGFDENALRLVYDYFAREEIVKESKRLTEAQLDTEAKLGGKIPTLLSLVRQAVLAQEAPVARAQIGYALDTVMKEYGRLFGDADIPAILRCLRDSWLDYDETGRKLLYRRVVLEYENGNQRIEPHPLVLRNSRIVEALKPKPPIPSIGI